MTQATLTKALSIQIEATDMHNTLKAHSGTDASKSYAVFFNGTRALLCSCPATVRCSHMLAAETFLQANEQQRIEEEETRQSYLRMFYSQY